MSNPTQGPEVVANRDINASDALSAAYPSLRPLIENVPISSAFALHNAAAIRWKTIYERFGRVGLFSVLFAMLIFDYQITLQPLYGGVALLSVFSTALAGAGLASQLFLVFSNAKEKWITQRFIAERLRCLKFQAFALLASTSAPEELRNDVATWTRETLATLNQETLGGRSAVLEFSPSEIAIPSPVASRQDNAALLTDAYKVYESLRLNVQAQHFAEQYRLAERKARWPAVLSEFGFGAGVLLAFLQISITSWTELVAAGDSQRLSGTRGWLSFLTLFLFIISAVVAVYQRGSGQQPDAERYLTFVREVRRIKMLSAVDRKQSYLQTVKEMEEVALRELHDFCRDAKQSNYIF